MRYYPIFLNLRGRRCVVVGGGKVAERKVQSLLRAGALVNVISPELTPRLARLAARKKISVIRSAYTGGDLRAWKSKRRLPLLVFAATSDPDTQRAVRRDAEAVGALVNVADDPRGSTFLVPASFAQGDLQVAISTSGASPALARKLRQDLEVTVGQEYEVYVRFLREARKKIRKSIAAQRLRAQVFRQLARRLDGWFRLGGKRRAQSELDRLLQEVRVGSARTSEGQPADQP